MKIDKAFLRNLILYGIIGAISAGADALVFYLLFRHAGVNEFAANVVSVHLGIFLSFFLNSRYNFRKTDQFKRRFTSFYLTGLLGLGLSTLILYLGQQLNADVMITKLFSVVFVALVQFIINRVFAFGDK
jgi:putative flippase GtrA